MKKNFCKFEGEGWELATFSRTTHSNSERSDPFLENTFLSYGFSNEIIQWNNHKANWDKELGSRNKFKIDFAGNNPKNKKKTL